MEHQRIVQILESYRPGEGLESDPEVREALHRATADPQLAEIRQASEAFDAAFAAKIRAVQVPSDLKASILEAARAQGSAPHEASPRMEDENTFIKWIHPVFLGAAAAIIILLALSFTYLIQPGGNQGEIERLMEENRLMATADQLYRSLNPSFRSNQPSEVIAHLRNHGGVLPAGLAGSLVPEESFACDVIDINGQSVSVLCFKGPDGSKSMHLFTFPRSAFPEVEVSPNPRIHSSDGSCCATWIEDDHIHVLYSDKGEENLRQVLDI